MLVDYFVELADVSHDINTQEIKQMFHDALTAVPVSVVPLPGEYGSSDAADFNDNIDDDFNDEIRPQKMKDNYLLGKFVLDPVATDFIGMFADIFVHLSSDICSSYGFVCSMFAHLVIRKQRVLPTVENIEQNSIIPQWAMAVIVIGVGSLLFVVIFGVAVVSRQVLRNCAATRNETN